MSRDPTNPYLRLGKRVVQVGAAVAWEKVRQPTGATSAEIPRSAEAISAAWLTAVLCKRVPGAEVVRHELLGGSDGTSSRRALRVFYNDAGAAAGLPTQLFVKTTSKLSQRLVLGLADLLHGETLFYNDARPHANIEAPHGYFAGVDDRSWRSLTLTDDVATRGATFPTPTTVVGHEEIEQLLTTMAGWHGAFWNSPQLTAARWSKTPTDHMRIIDSFISLRKQSAAGVKRASDVIPPGFQNRHEHIYAALERWMRRAGEGELTLLHGDAHIRNTYFTAAGTGGFLDWQMAMRGNWAYDVAFLVVSALTVTDRRDWERELLAHYLDRLAVTGGSAPPFDDAWTTYRQAMNYPYITWTYTIGRSAVQPEYQPVEYCLPIIERAAHAIDDLQSDTA